MGKFYLYKENFLTFPSGVYRRPSPLGFQILGHAVSSPADSKKELAGQSTKTKARTDRAEEFAAFLAKDAELNLFKMVPLTEDRLAKAKRLVKGERLD